jgi:2-desacetyl-2-hydroxyethyl bacteriochlorophyllide A dehydrogenase
MKAMIWTKYGPPDVLQLQEVEKPSPQEKEVLIRVHAATVTAGDCEIRSLKLPILFRVPIRLYAGFIKPKRITILGQELAGTVEGVGSQVTRFKEGDKVFAPSFFRFGAYAEYVCLPETYPVLMPVNMTFEEAATIPTGGVNGLHFLRAANLRPGEKLLINGAGGSIGTYAVQIAKAFGAQVTAVDSAEKLDMLRSTGADHVIDYRQEDFTRSGETYDVIVDVAGKSPFSSSVEVLKPGGRYILGNANLVNMVRARWAPMTAGKKVVVALANYQPEDYITLKELIEAGKIKPVIDQRYPLEQTAEAHRYVEAGHKKGNVIILVRPSP